MVSYPDRPCPVCKGPMTDRQRSACSGKCRAAWSRKKKAEAQEEREREVTAALDEAEETIRKVRGIIAGEETRVI